MTDDKRFKDNFVGTITKASQPTKRADLFADFDLINLIETIQDQNLREQAQKAWTDNDMVTLKQVFEQVGIVTDLV